MPAFSRSVEVTMDWLDSSSFEIRGTLNDNVHSLSARFVMSFPDFVIRDAAGDITAMPYPGICQGSLAALQGLIGERIGRGFRRRAGEIVGGAASCNHLHTLVTNMAACAFQMNYVAAKQNPKAAEEMKKVRDDARLRREMVLGWMPQLRNSCFVFSEAADPLFQLTMEKKDDGSTLNLNEE
ncbi:MAG TPA: DUF2889 domain-containing protein [Blastocatellia bacterium]|nr:DUF2889 domain-containing protein [Blastocatellia bacterium]